MRRRDTLNETLKKCRIRAGSYREHVLTQAFPRIGEKIYEKELAESAPQSNYGPASNFQGPPTNILGKMEAGVVQGRLREETQCYRLIIGQGWLMLVNKEDESKWLPYSMQYWIKPGPDAKGEKY
jgi:hypothetical protein